MDGRPILVMNLDSYGPKLFQLGHQILADMVVVIY